MGRQDQFSIGVTVQGVNITGVWDKMTGGDVDSEETKYKPGAMGAPVSLGGVKTVNNVVVSRLYDPVRDNPLVAQLLPIVGRAAMSVSKQSLDSDGHTTGGSPLTYLGVLKNCTLPEPDSESSAAAMIQLELSSATVS